MGTRFDSKVHHVHRPLLLPSFVHCLIFTLVGYSSFITDLNSCHCNNSTNIFHCQLLLLVYNKWISFKFNPFLPLCCNTKDEVGWNKIVLDNSKKRCCNAVDSWFDVSFLCNCELWIVLRFYQFMSNLRRGIWVVSCVGWVGEIGSR